MNAVTEIRQYTKEVQETIAGLNLHKVVIDDSQMTKVLSEMSPDHNCLLLGVIPDLSNYDANPDAFQPSTTTAFMILKKTDYSDHNHDEFLQIFEDTFEIARAVLAKMIGDATEGCSLLRYLDANTVLMTPIWNKNGCHGWTINFQLDMPLW